MDHNNVRPKVSIIVPTYNVEQYLRQCLESLRRQTLKEIEIICVNDGSKDGSLAILREYADMDPRFILIDKENGGYGMAMNRGYDRASGEYIGIVEPDDHVKLTMFEDLYEAASANQLDFVKADFYRFVTNDDNGDIHWFYNQLDKSGKWYGKVVNPGETPELTRFIMNTWSGIYRRDFLEEHRIRHHETPGAAFQDNGFFWQTFIYAKRAMFLNEPYYLNRRDNPNSSVNSREKIYCMNDEYAYIRQIFDQPGNEELWERFKTYFRLKQFYNYMFTLGRIGDDYRKEYVQKISREFIQYRRNGELDMDLLAGESLKKARMLMDQPERFYETYGKYRNSEGTAGFETAADKRVRELENSTTYRVGKLVMALPIKAKNILKRLERKK